MTELNTAYNEANEKYECTLGDISDDDAAKLTAMGIKMKQKSFAPNVIVCKSKFPYIVADQSGNEISISDIGNGTEVECLVSFYSHKMSKMHGNAPTLVYKKGTPALQVTKLLTYVPPEEELDDLPL